ncbi:hypothetical protein DXT97_24080 [Agrobacterium tumefaciens]|nr:hypothetical protein [Agrobacterium tumefaciens]
MQNISSVMLGPVPSICNAPIYETLADPRHKTEDDVVNTEEPIPAQFPLYQAASCTRCPSETSR